MRSSILTLGLACALGLSAPGAAEGASPQSPSPGGAAPASKAAEAPAAGAPVAQTPKPAAGAAAPASKAAQARTSKSAAKDQTSKAPAQAEAAKPAADSQAQAAGGAAKEAKAAPEAAASGKAAPAPAAARHEVVLGPVVTDAQGRTGRIHEVKRGDTLWDISDAYLGTPWVWPSIWKSNADIANPNLIFPGDKIFVSPSEMRKLTDREAADMMAAQGQAPAALGGDGMPAGEPSPRTYRFSEIQTAGVVSTKALRGAASIIDSTVERVWLGDHDRVIVGLGESEVKVGDQFEIFRTTQKVHDPDTGLPIGYATLQLGWLEIREVHPESSIGIIRVSRGEIRRGDRLLPRQRPASEITVGQSPQVEGRVVYTWADRMEIGGNDLVYLNRGSDAGLEVGSPLEVYRPIGTGVDQAQKRERELPDQIVARMLVVATTPVTATAVVTHASTEVENGDHFRGSDRIWY